VNDYEVYGLVTKNPIKFAAKTKNPNFLPPKGFYEWFTDVCNLVMYSKLKFYPMY
jgi:hypothetical protein